MKYDLIIVGGGPGGLMAAKTAAEDGLKVVLIERKRNITEINRACSQIFYVRKLTVMADDKSDTGEMHRDGYIEPVSIEYDDKTTRFHFPAPGFSLDYDGCLRPYLNWIYISPSGHSINQYHWNDRPWGFYFHKETFLVGLLASVKKAKAEVLSETIGLGAENTKYGVKVRVRSKSSEQTLEAKAAIAADGVSSSIVESLGLNKKRQILWKGSERAGFVHYIVEGIETGFPDSSWLSWAIPSINPGGSVMIGLSADNSYTVGAATTNAVAVIEKFMSDPRYAHMFRQARIMKREVVPFTGIVRVPLSEPVAGNVVVIGDAAAPIETWTQGAVACGYQAVKAIEKELNGQKGYPDYIDWWQQAFAFNNPEYSRTLSVLYLLHGICSDEDIDYIYSLFQGRVGIPAMLVARNMDLIKKERPEIYNKLANR